MGNFGLLYILASGHTGGFPLESDKVCFWVGEVEERERVRFVKSEFLFLNYTETQTDQIWQNFATFAKYSKSWAKF